MIIDSEGKRHHSIEMKRDELVKAKAFGDPSQLREYEAGLTHYLIDGVEVSEAEFRRLFPKPK